MRLPGNIKTKIINKLKIKTKNKINTKINLNKKVISILGTGGVGKSIATINIANLLKENNGTDQVYVT